MQQFLGEYECRLEPKGRVRLPSLLLRQVGEESKAGFVMNRGFEKCLVLYPSKVWQNITTELQKLNLYVKKERDFVRYFFRGATEIQLDSNDRILIPKILVDYIEADKDLILFAYFDRIEVWAKEVYDQLLENEPTDFAALAEEVMGKKIRGGEADSDVS